MRIRARPDTPGNIFHARMPRVAHASSKREKKRGTTLVCKHGRPGSKNVSLKGGRHNATERWNRTATRWWSRKWRRGWRWKWRRGRKDGWSLCGRSRRRVCMSQVRTENATHSRTALQPAEMPRLWCKHDARVKADLKKGELLCQEEMEQARRVLVR